MNKVQIEVTTRCNFKCFYCAGRKMEQKDMSHEQFLKIMTGHFKKYGGITSQVSLQGEGEPTLNPDLFKMAASLKMLGIKVSTITNGSYKHPEEFIGCFDEVGVSIDSLDDAKAAAIGRFNIARTLSFIDAIRTKIPVTIFTIDRKDGEIETIKEYCKAKNLKLMVQPLQHKEDYRVNYIDIIPEPKRVHKKPFTCLVAQGRHYRFYNIDGVEMPCPFIKDISKFPGIDEVYDAVGKDTPACCEGCGNL